MKKADISIVMSTFNRGHLLRRSLEGYERQHFGGSFEIVVVDDDSNDDTRNVLEEFSRRLDIKHVFVRKPQGTTWRDCAATINIGLRASNGLFVVGTHPEVVPGMTTVEEAVKTARDGVYVAANIYYLSPDNQKLIDTVDWRGSGNTALRALPGFYSCDSAEYRGNPDYTVRKAEEHIKWESWVWGGLTRKTWRDIGGLSEFDTWGSVDVDFLQRRLVLGIPNHTLKDDETICIHQNHDVAVRDTDVLTARDGNKVFGPLKRYQNAQEAVKDNF